MSLRWAHTHFVGFVMLWLTWFCLILLLKWLFSLLLFQTILSRRHLIIFIEKQEIVDSGSVIDCSCFVTKLE